MEAKQEAGSPEGAIPRSPPMGQPAPKTCIPLRTRSAKLNVRHRSPLSSQVLFNHEHHEYSANSFTILFAAWHLQPSLPQLPVPNRARQSTCALVAKESKSRDTGLSSESASHQPAVLPFFLCQKSQEGRKRPPLFQVASKLAVVMHSS